MMLRDILWIIYALAILLSAVIAIVHRKWFAERLLLPFIPFLLYVFIQELVLETGYRLELIISNAAVYNLFRLITVVFFGVLYSRLPFMKVMQRPILLLVIFYFIFFLVNFTLIQSLTEQSSYMVLARSLVVSLFAIFFLFRYFHLDERKQAEFWSPWVWITTGIIVFYPVVSISQTFQQYLYKYDARFYGFKLYQLIPQVMSIFMYACFSYAFYLCKKRR